MAVGDGGGGGSFAEIVDFTKDMMVRMDAERQELQAQLEAQQLAFDAKLQPVPLVSDEQLQSLQARLEALNQSQLLSDDEFDALSDCVGDFIGVPNHNIGFS